MEKLKKKKVLKKLKNLRKVVPKRKLKKAIEIIRFILFYLLIFLALIIIFSTNWAKENYQFNDFDQILFTLNNSVTSASNEIIISFIKSNILIPLLLTLVIIGLFRFIKYLFKNYTVFIKLKVRSKLFKINFYTIVKIFFIISILSYSIYYIMDNLYIFNYIENSSKNSNFFEANYVNPKEVELEFPKKKRNLIYIFSESMESTYANKKNGGAYDYNYIKELTRLAKDNNSINFSANNLIGGAHMAYDTSWTIAATIAQTSGVPLKSAFGQNDIKSYENGLVNGAYSIGEILEKEGYKNYIMVGSDLTFGGRRVYYQNHGNYKVYDYYTAKEDEVIDEDYYVNWGLEDAVLFDYAKQELTKIAKNDEPFNFTMLTVDTHANDGYVSDFCKNVTDDKYLNAVACSSEQLGEFINWIKKQDFYENTTIVLVGDHLSMNTYSFDNIDPNYDRRVYNVFINSAIDTNCNKNREFNSFDYYPTTLASLGVKINGERLGLGTNLFSCKESLSEIYGNDFINEELKGSSEFYDECINNNNCN